jgi:hypothetical protein
MQVGALRGAIMLARAVIEATAKDKGVTNGSLSQKIDRLHERGCIRTYLRDGAHEVRYQGCGRSRMLRQCWPEGFPVTMRPWGRVGA